MILFLSGVIIMTFYFLPTEKSEQREKLHGEEAKKIDKYKW